MSIEVIILCGGLGKRLRPVVQDVPKPMAPIKGKPFLAFVLDFLALYAVKKVVLSVGYKANMIQSYFKSSYKGMLIEYAIEQEPLGTGGAIKNALSYCQHSTVVVMNGDTYFPLDLQALLMTHEQLKSDITLSLKPMCDFDRYGSVELKGEYVSNFKEKSFCKQGLINGGVYALERGILDAYKDFVSFSFEQDFLERSCQKVIMGAYIDDSDFIDIGLPKDYKLAQKILLDFLQN